MKKIIILLLGLLVLFSTARAETDGDCIYTLLNADGEVLTRRAGRMYEGDEYISGDNRHYRIAFVDDARCTATAEDLGPSIPDQQAFAAFMSAHAEKKDKENGTVNKFT
jgi:hypothetical protein